MAIEKGQGLKRGEKVQRICTIQILDAHGEPLEEITPADVVLEGFPEMSVDEFIDMFCRVNRAKKCTLQTTVNRIAFPFVDDDAPDWLAVNRTHEECVECAKEEADPPVCKGHAPGESSCREFVPSE